MGLSGWQGSFDFAAFWNTLDGFAELLAGEVEFVGALEVHPEIG
jgi:hypothetical protein